MLEWLGCGAICPHQLLVGAVGAVLLLRFLFFVRRLAARSRGQRT